MAKKVCGFSLDEETIEALDEASKVLGMSRSQIANLVLRGALGDAPAGDVVKAMYASAMEKDKKRVDNLQPA